jgi:hypothetical protein
MAAEQITLLNTSSAARSSGRTGLVFTVAMAMAFLAVSEVSRNQAAAYMPGGFFTAEARKCLTERIENLAPSTQRLCFALNSLVELADVVDEKTMEEALRRGICNFQLFHFQSVFFFPFFN